MSQAGLTRRNAWRLWCALLVVAIGVALGDVALQRLVAKPEASAADAGTGWTALKQAANLIHMASMPVQMPARLVLVTAGYSGGAAGWMCGTLPFRLAAWVVLVFSGAGVYQTARMAMRRTRSLAAAKAGDHLAEPDRRRVLQLGVQLGVRGGLVGGGLIAGGTKLAVAHAVAIAPYDLRTTRYDMPVSDLPAAFEGWRIVQLTDTHLGRRVPTRHIEHAVARAVGLDPELFVLTGDYVDHGRWAIRPAVDVLRPLVDTGRPVLSVLGNHDWFDDGPLMQRTLAGAGMRPIDNDRRFLAADGRVHDEPVADGLCIAGVGDLKYDRVDFDAALAGVPSAMPRIVLSHQPDAAELPAWHRVDLMLSGHTHGGQVRLPVLGSPVVPSRYGQKYACGLVRGPRWPVIVASGVGTSMLPVRFGMPPEIVEITLRRAGPATVGRDG